MSASTFTLIGLGLCVLIVFALCFLAIRRFDQMTLGEAQPHEDEDVLELEQLSFDQVTNVDGIETAEIEALSDAEESAPAMDDANDAETEASIAGAGAQLASVEFGIRPEELIADQARPRLKFTMALLNKSTATLVSIRVTTDLVIYDPQVEQGVRPSAPNLRHDALARLEPGEKIMMHGDWALPDGLLAMFADSESKGAYVLARARIIGANVAPKSQYFLIGHLLADSRLLPLTDDARAFTQLGVTEAQESDEPAPG